MIQALSLKTKNTARSRGWQARRLAIGAVALIAVQATGLPQTVSFSNPQPVQAAEKTALGNRAFEASIRPSAIGGSTPAVNTQISLPAPSVEAASIQTASTLPPPVAPAAAAVIWRGTAGQEGCLRAGPSRSAAKIGELQPGQPIQVVRWVSGDEVETENTTWADLGNGRYAYSALLRSQPLAATPPPPANAPMQGKWIDINLTLQVATAYNGDTPLKSVLVSTGRPGWDTPRGTFGIQRRVAKETMDGSTLAGQGPNGAGATYKVEHVRWTQYFTADGSAIHENYWRNPALMGIPGSHGCIGMLPADAAWFWDFAATGTPLVIH